MRKAVTLMELIIAISLMGIVILGVTSFDLGSRQTLKSSERKTQILNEAALILDRISKDALTAIGYVGNPAITVNPGNITIQQNSNVTYAFDANNHRLTRNGEVISNHIINFSADTPLGNAVKVNLTLMYNPALAVDVFDNPEVTVQTNIVAPNWSVN